MIQITWRCKTCDMTGAIEVADLDARMSHVEELIKDDHDNTWCYTTNHTEFEVVGATGVTHGDLH